MQQRGRTIKKTKPLTPADSSSTTIKSIILPHNQIHDLGAGMEKGMDDFLMSENKSTLKRPWVKLDRALKLDRLRHYADNYPELTQEEKLRLNTCIKTALDKKVLQLRASVTYNTNTCKIDEIKGLVITETDLGKHFRIDPARVTKRRVRSSGSQSE